VKGWDGLLAETGRRPLMSPNVTRSALPFPCCSTPDLSGLNAPGSKLSLRTHTTAFRLFCKDAATHKRVWLSVWRILEKALGPNDPVSQSFEFRATMTLAASGATKVVDQTAASVGEIGAIGAWCVRCHSKRRPKLSCHRGRPLASTDCLQT